MIDQTIKFFNFQFSQKKGGCYDNYTTRCPENSPRCPRGKISRREKRGRRQRQGYCQFGRLLWRF